MQQAAVSSEVYNQHVQEAAKPTPLTTMSSPIALVGEEFAVVSKERCAIAFLALSVTILAQLSLTIGYGIPQKWEIGTAIFVQVLGLFGSAYSIFAIVQTAIGVISKGALSSEVLLSLGCIGVIASNIIMVITQGSVVNWNVSFGAVAALMAICLYGRSRLIDLLNFRSLVALSEVTPRIRLIEVKEGIVCGDQVALTGQMGLPLTEKWVDPNKCRTGDVIRLGVGEICPCDGLVVDGITQVLERRLSGRTTRIIKSHGATIFAGSEVLSGHLDLKVVAPPEDTAYSYFAKRAASIRDAEYAADSGGLKHYNTFLYVILGGAIVAPLTWNWLGGDIASFGLIMAAVSFVVLFPEMLRLSQRVKRAFGVKLFRLGVLPRGVGCVDKLKGIKSCVVDYYEPPLGSPVATSFEMLDERVDKGSLASALVSIFGSASEENILAIAEFLRVEVPNIKGIDVEELTEFSGKGLVATVKGAEFTIGNEAFLIERGVQLAASEIPKDVGDDTLVLVAIHDELVARFRIAPRFVKDGADLRSRLRESGHRVILCSERSGDVLDVLGKKAGFELSELCGNLSKDSYSAKISSVGPTLFYGNAKTHPELLSYPSASIVVFDEFLWNDDKGDFTAYGRNLEILSDVALAAKDFFAFEKYAFHGSLFFSIGLLVFAGFGLFGPSLVLACELLFGFVVYRWAMRIAGTIN